MKTLALLTLLLLGHSAFSQQNVTFNLNTGKFDQKLSYIEHIVIEGEPIKGTTKIDIIELEVTKKNTSFDKQIEKKELELGQTEIRINSLDTLIEEEGVAKEYLDKYKKKVQALEKEKSESGPNVAALEKEVAGIKTASVAYHEAQKTLEEAKKASLITEIAELKVKAKKNTDVERIVWNNDGSEKKFKLTLSKILAMEETYEFQFKLYTHQKAEFPVNTITENMVKEIIRRIDNAESTAASVIDPIVENYLDSVAKKYFGAKQVFDEATKTFKKTDAGTLSKKKEILKNFKELAAPYEKHLLYMGKLMDSTVVLQQKVANLANGASLIQDTAAQKKLKDLFMAFDADKKPYFDALMLQFNIDTAQSSAIWQYAKDISLDVSVRLMTDAKAEVDSLTKVLNGLIAPQVKALYIKEHEITHSKVGASEDTKLDATRIGTHYGVGAIFLDNDFEAVELTQYIALNFRLGPYDNRLSGNDAFKTHLSRWSFVFGIGVTSDLQYKGQALVNTRLGIKPMIGVSFQPMKHMDISLSTLAFNQESISAEQSYSLTKFRPMLGIAFDFNAVNYLINKNK